MFFDYSDASTSKKISHKADFLPSNCASFSDVNNNQMDVFIKSGLPLCKKTKWGKYDVYLTNFESSYGDFPVVIYRDSAIIHKVVVHIHGGPRSLVGLVEPILIYGKAAKNIAFVRPTYIGSLNRTNYPAQDYVDAVDEIRKTILIARSLHAQTFLSADSAGAFLLQKSCDRKCRETFIFLAPMTLSPHDTTILNRRNSAFCLNNSQEKSCQENIIDKDINANFFGKMFANKIVKTREGKYSSYKIIIDGNTQSEMFYGDKIYRADFNFFENSKSCNHIIYDTRDPIIGVKKIETFMTHFCRNYLHHVENFKHPSFLNAAGGIALYWDIIEDRLSL